MDDREAGTYSTPKGAGSSSSETKAAQERMSRGLPLLFGSVFIAFVLVAAIVFVFRYLV
jgi:hypothetical protein